MKTVISRKWIWGGLAVGIIAISLVAMSFLTTSLAGVGFYDSNFEVFIETGPLSDQQKQSLQASFNNHVWLPLFPMVAAVTLLLGFLGTLLFHHRK